MNSPEHIVSQSATIAVAVFCLVYLLFLGRQIYRGSIDLYDFLMLSAIAVVPAIFVLVPGTAQFVAGAFGVVFPFVIMFSVLLLIVFILVHHMIVRLNALEKTLRHLIQEVGIASMPQNAPRRRDST